MYLGQIASNLSKFDLKILVRVFSIEVKREILIIKQKPLFCGQSKASMFYGTPGIFLVFWFLWASAHLFYQNEFYLGF